MQKQCGGLKRPWKPFTLSKVSLEEALWKNPISFVPNILSQGLVKGACYSLEWGQKKQYYGYSSHDISISCNPISHSHRTLTKNHGLNWTDYTRAFTRPQGNSRLKELRRILKLLLPLFLLGHDFCASALGTGHRISLWFAQSCRFQNYFRCQEFSVCLLYAVL